MLRPVPFSHQKQKKSTLRIETLPLVNRTLHYQNAHQKPLSRKCYSINTGSDDLQISIMKVPFTVTQGIMFGNNFGLQ